MRDHLTKFSNLLANHAAGDGLSDHMQCLTTPSGHEKLAIVSKTRIWHDGGVKLAA